MIDKYLWREGKKDRGFLSGTIVAGVLSGLGGAVQAYVLAYIIVATFAGEMTLDAVKAPLILLLAIVLMRALLSWAEEFFALRLAGGVQQRLRTQVLEKIARMGPVGMGEEKRGEILTLMTEGLDTLEVYFQKYLPQLFKSAVLPIVFLVLVFPLDWITGLIMIITAPLVPVFMMLIGQWTKRQTTKQWRVLADMGGYFQDVLEGLTTLKQFDRTAEQHRKIDDVSDNFRRVSLNVLKWAFLSAFVLELLTTLSIALIAVGLGTRLVYGMLDFQAALFLLFLAPDFYLPLRSLGTQYHNSLNGVEAAKDIFRFLEQPEVAVAGGSHVCTDELELCFDNVSFAYEEGRNALERVSFTVAPGEKVGIVGMSGGGKTTLMQLIMGFVKADEGEVRFGGQVIDKLDMASLRKQIAVVPPSPYLFRGTIMENIRVGNEEASKEDVVELCRLIGADDFIRQLPLGYDTPVGQGGHGLSGGEGQLLAIARACLRDAPLVLLDEATKNLDWQRDTVVQRAIDHLTAGKTVIAIAHRLQTVARMDKLLVMEEGHLVDEGSPEELRRRGSTFVHRLDASPTMDSTEEQVSPEPSSRYATPSPPDVRPAQSVQRGKRRRSIGTMLELCESYKGMMAAAALLGAAAIGANICLLGVSALLITRASFMPPILDLMVLIVAVRFFGISRAVFRYGERYYSHDVTFRILKRLRIWYYEQMEKLSYVSLQRLGMGRVFKHIIGDVDVLKYFYLRVLNVPLIAIVILLGVCIYLAFYSWKMVLLVVVFFLLGGIIFPWLFRRVYRGRRADHEEIKQRYHETIYDYMGGLVEAEIFGMTARKQREIEACGDGLVEEQRRIGAWDSFSQVSSALLANLALWGGLLIMIPLVYNGSVDGVFLATVVWVAWAAFEALQPVTVATEYLNQSEGALEEMEDAASREREPRREGGASLPASAGLQVSHLSFAYDGEHRVLDDISFDLPATSKMALVGGSGAGKTTLVNLLTGFLGYEQGSIRGGGVEFSTVDVADLRRKIGYLGQRPYLFHASIRDNILLAKADASEEELRQAATKAQIDTFIERLPEGYDTMVGENGYKLSAGQRQRLALARLFLQDAPIVILDEPTQNLDYENRNELLASLHNWWQQKTVLYITHDLYGLEEMDHILVLDEGKLIEQGSAKQLIAAGGYYAQLRRLEKDFI